MLVACIVNWKVFSAIATASACVSSAVVVRDVVTTPPAPASQKISYYVIATPVPPAFTPVRADHISCRFDVVDRVTS